MSVWKICATPYKNIKAKEGKKYFYNIFYIVLQVGEKYALENEEELKDKMNFEEHPNYRLPTGNHWL